MLFLKTSNSIQQNPCQIAGMLEAECQGPGAFELPLHFHLSNSLSPAVYELGPLQQRSNYITPQRNSSAQKCECNTVMFRYMADLHACLAQALIIALCSLYMACTACQNVSTEPWSYWSQYCDTVYIAQYPGDIPPNTAVPNWAYLDYTVSARILEVPRALLPRLGWRQVRSCSRQIRRLSAGESCIEFIVIDLVESKHRADR